MTESVLVVESVHKRFGALPVLRGVDLSVERGQVLCILGPSGSGKSTLLRCINHLETVDAGAIRLNGEMVGYDLRRGRLYERSERDVARMRVRIGMVFQHFNLFGHLTAVDNVACGLIRVKGVSPQSARETARQLLDQVGLQEKFDTYPSQLSGGQQQRVAIARALAMEPDLILFDEPTSALDPELVAGVLAVMRALAEAGMTMVVVTHEITFAREVADTAVVMEGGVVIESGTAQEVLSNPQSDRAIRFLRRVESGRNVKVATEEKE